MLSRSICYAWMRQLAHLVGRVVMGREVIADYDGNLQAKYGNENEIDPAVITMMHPNGTRQAPRQV